MMRVVSLDASETASRAAASGRQRKTMSASLISALRAAGSLRSAGSMRKSSMSPRGSSRSKIRSPVVPSLPSMYTFGFISVLLVCQMDESLSFPAA